MGILDALLLDPKIEALMGDPARIAAMVRVERALAEVEGRLDVIDAGIAATIVAQLEGFAPDAADLARGTAGAGVPVPALVAQLRRAVDGEAGGFVHWGATSQDILDTALVLQLREALALIEGRLVRLTTALGTLAAAHAGTVMLARTRFQQAVPTSFGLKVAGWLAPLLRHRARLDQLRPRLLVVQLGGAGGNLSALGEAGPAVMADLAQALDLGCPPLPWHNQRDGLAELGAWLALVTGSLGKMGQDVLLMAQNEVGELSEADGGGSSTMPQKANPVRSEALVTLARQNATLLASLHQAMLHAHERDGAAWQLEWLTLPAMVSAAGAALGHALDLVPTLVVDVDRMRANLEAAYGLPLAEAVSFALARHLPRAEAQRLAKEACEMALATRRDLVEILAERTDLPIDWPAVREAALRPPAAAIFIDHVLDPCPKCPSKEAI